MFTRLLQSALITFAAYLTMLASSSPMQQSTYSSSASTDRPELMKAQIQAMPKQLGKAVGTLPHPLKRSAKF